MNIHEAKSHYLDRIAERAGKRPDTHDESADQPSLAENAAKDVGSRAMHDVEVEATEQAQPDTP